MKRLQQISLTLLTAGALLAPALTFAATAPAATTQAAPAAAKADVRDAQKELGPLRKQIAALNLTAEQKTKIDKLLSDAQPTFAQLKQQDMENKQKMKEMGFKYDSNVQKLADAEGSIVSKRIVEGAKLRSAVYDVLTPEQQKQVEANQQQRAAAKAAKQAAKQPK